MQGATPHLMIVDELGVKAYESELTEDQFREAAEELSSGSDALGYLVDRRIANGKAALRIAGIAEEETPEVLLVGRDQAALHKKAVARRKKRKRGGHK